jgi:hypothetical protein
MANATSRAGNSCKPKSPPSATIPQIIHLVGIGSWVEGIFGNRRIQPFIHDTSITVHHNRKENTYYVFCQNHCRLPFNNAVIGTWRDDIIVMQARKNICGVLDMHAKTPKCGCYVNTRYTNERTTLCIIYHQKGLNEEILDHQTILCKMYSILRYKQNTTKVSICT